MPQRSRNRPYRSIRKRRRKTGRHVSVLLVIVAVIFGLGLSGCAIAAGYVLNISNSLPEVDVSKFINMQTSYVYDKDGRQYAKLRGAEDRRSVSLSEISPYLVDAVVATEDIRFYQHMGVDFIRIFGALRADLRSGNLGQGASTLTMQLARNAILNSQEKQLNRKVQEALLAIKIEQKYSKDEILTYYLNEVYWGHNAHGIQAASQLYFNCNAKDLDIGQSAMLAGILRSPNIYSPYKDMDRATNIRNVVLENMCRYKPEEYDGKVDALREETLKIEESQREAELYKYPWFTDYVIDETARILADLGLEEYLIYTGGFHIHTTLDSKIQLKMEEVYADPDNFPESSTGDQVESSMVVMDPVTGEIQGLLGGRDYLLRRGFNRATDLKRQPGSTMKPIAVYGAALEKNYGTGSVVVDEPTTFGKNYKPGNYDGSYRGPITMRTAVMFSVNIAAVKFLELIGVGTGFEFAKKLGMPLIEENDAHLAMALGGIHNGVSPLDMAGAYAVFANKGVYTRPYCISKIVDSQDRIIYEVNPEKNIAMSEASAYMMTDMLISTTTGGTGRRAAISGYQVASKTGTVELPDKPQFKGKSGNKDAWFAAFTPELVGVVWMGYDKDTDAEGNLQYLRRVFGSSYPLDIWKAVIKTGLEDREKGKFVRPKGVVSVAIDRKSGLLASDSTPREYVVYELFHAKSVPKEKSGSWITVTICTESNLIANSGCPETSTVSRLDPNKKEENKGRSDEALYAPTKTCDLHDPSSASSNNDITLKICTDPRHGEDIYLANIPKNNQSGGCPAEYTESRNFNIFNAPSKHCNLLEHKPVDIIDGNHDINNNDPGDGNQDPDPGDDDIDGSNKTDDEPDPDNPDDEKSDQEGSNGENSIPNLVAPGSLTSSRTKNGIRISWNDNSNKDVAYVVERSAGGMQIQLSAWNTSLEDNNLETGGNYSYRVRAYHAASGTYSPWSSTITISY
ncbi:MAG: PBP1A family penicillin-binding protein [Clostridiales bacterium]|nr:PBP1A family penicillin-binding protein [Clostridiales bacterium]